MKKISIFDCGIHLGGAEKSAELMIKYLKGNFNFNLYIPKDAKMQADCNITRIDIDEKYFTQNKISILSLIVFFKLFYYGFTHIFDSIVLTNTFKSHIIGFANKIKHPEIKWIMIERDVPENIFIKILKFLLHKMADEVIFNSHFLSKRYFKIKNTSIIYNIIENKRTGKKKYFNRFLYIGDITYSKGIDRAIDIFKGLDIEDKQLFIIGEIPKYQKNIRIYKNKNIIYTGYSEPHSYYEKAGFLLLFNRRIESFSRIVAESLNYGVIPIVLKNNGMDDYIDNGKNGIVFEYYDYSTIVNFLNDFIKNKKYNNMDIQIDNKVFNIDTIKNKWLEII